MSNLFIAVILAILTIVIVLRVATRPGKRVSAKRSQSSISAASKSDRSSAQWRAVKIEPGLMSCDAAGKLAGKVFLSRESPGLPLDGCVEKDCRCKYVHLEDRRDSGERRIELGGLDAFLPVTENQRRQVSGRRSEDLSVSTGLSKAANKGRRAPTSRLTKHRRVP